MLEQRVSLGFDGSVDGLEIAAIPFEKRRAMAASGGSWRTRGGRLCAAGLLLLPMVLPEGALGQPALSPPALSPAPGPSQAPVLAPSLLSPPDHMPPGGRLPSGGPAVGAPGLFAPAQPATPANPAISRPIATVPPGQVALALSARYGREPPPIAGGLVWRVFADQPDANGQFRLIREDRNPSPVFLLPPGGYIVHASFGLASSVKRVQLRAETVREVFEIPAGGVRFEGRVGDSRIPAAQISFDVYPGTQLEVGDKRPIAENVGSGDVLLLPEGTYHVVSTYGDGNAVTRSDLRVQAGKLTDAVIVHRAARITLKLVGERGGDALANTAWSVLTPGGDVIKEAIGAFPTVILAEGDYIVVARNEGKIYNREFKVEAGFDREVEVLAR